MIGLESDLSSMFLMARKYNPVNLKIVSPTFTRFSIQISKYFKTLTKMKKIGDPEKKDREKNVFCFLSKSIFNTRA